MLVGRVTGSVVSTNKVSSLRGSKMLIVQPVDLETLQMKDDYVVAIDDVGAGEGDFSVYGIIDTIDMRGMRTYDKAKETAACSWQE